LVYSIITADVDEAIEMTWVDGKDETHEAGTTTGLTHDVGTTTVEGTYTNDETGTNVTCVYGTLRITLDGTDEGTLVYSTTTIPEVMVIT
jgi:hypothetical protein